MLGEIETRTPTHLVRKHAGDPPLVWLMILILIDRTTLYTETLNESKYSTTKLENINNIDTNDYPRTFVSLTDGLKA